MNRTAQPGLDRSTTSLLRPALLAIGGVALMTLAAKTHIPFWPVPMTLQTLAIMAFAIGLGPRAATLVFAAYLGAGAMGLPVFADSPARGIGLAYLAGPTGGYLAGSLAASWLVGTLAQGRGTAGRLGAMLAGLALIYAAGIAWLARIVPADHLIALGVAPFILCDLVKIGLVAAGAALLPPRFRFG